MTLVVDAGVIAAALIDDGPGGRQAESLVLAERLAAPHLIHVEVAHVLRRAVAAGKVSAADAGAAHSEMLGFPLDLFGYGAYAGRIWALRDSVTPYDAWYVALAEALEACLATTDARLARAPGPRCEFLVLEHSPEP